MRKLFLIATFAAALAAAQTPPATAPQGNAPQGRGGPPSNNPPARTTKKVLVFGMAKGFHHDSISTAMATVWKLGKESGEWDTEIYTDPDVIRKPADGKPGGGFRPLNLQNFDASCGPARPAKRR